MLNVIRTIQHAHRKILLLTLLNEGRAFAGSSPMENICYWHQFTDRILAKCLPRESQFTA